MKLLDSFKVATGKTLPGFVSIFTVDDETRHVTVQLSSDGQTMLIGFDSTKGLVWPPSRDWLSNLQAWPKAMTFGSSHCMAHSGFVDEYASVRMHIINAITFHKPKSIIISGFSQGGAHATLCFRDLLHNFQKIKVDAIAFASPRVYDMHGSAEFESALDKRHDCSFLRVNAWGDPVPELVPWFIGYCHVGKWKMVGKFAIFDANVHNGVGYLKVLEGL